MLNHTTAPVRSYGWVTDLRSSLRTRREASAARRRLRDELASYRTPSEVEDIYAALRRNEDTADDEVRRMILAHVGSSHRILA